MLYASTCEFLVYVDVVQCCLGGKCLSRVSIFVFARVKTMDIANAQNTTVLAAGCSLRIKLVHRNNMCVHALCKDYVYTHTHYGRFVELEKGKY